MFVPINIILIINLIIHGFILLNVVLLIMFIALNFYLRYTNNFYEISKIKNALVTTLSLCSPFILLIINKYNSLFSFIGILLIITIQYYFLFKDLEEEGFNFKSFFMFLSNYFIFLLYFISFNCLFKKINDPIYIQNLSLFQYHKYIVILAIVISFIVISLIIKIKLKSLNWEPLYKKINYLQLKEQVDLLIKYYWPSVISIIIFNII